MEYAIETQLPQLNTTEVLVVGFFEGQDASPQVNALNEVQAAQIKQLRPRLKKKGQILCHIDSNGQSLILLHLGEKETFSAQELAKRSQDICQQLKQQGFSSASLLFPHEPERSADFLEKLIAALDQALYQFEHFKSKATPLSLTRILIYSETAHPALLKEIAALNSGVRMARDLGNTPANICTPTYLAATAEELANHYDKIACKIFGPQSIQEMGMGALLAVAAGSEEEPRFIELQYQNGGHKKPLVLVGKGITFDSGGISIKPAAGMEEMKYDMCGAAAVLGVMKACAEMELPVNLIGLIASAENMLSGKATKPGDVVTSMSGQSIEIVNTDAEGRLVLADALTYAEQFKPEWVIDIATLTGAMVVALGSVYTGFMTQDKALADQIQAAGEASQDRCWPMPLDEEYQSALDSPVADILNATFDRSAGSITAACFLSRFSKHYRWAHMDIAGTAWNSGKNRNATGRPVPVLVKLLQQYAHAR
ncbi:MAG: leucyl aminopeptidase [Legionellaceae bacterium]|nr:leucyl aminopeptidase [Legionellaceae bacterium]